MELPNGRPLTAAQRVLYRFFAAYFIIYIFPFPCDLFAEGLWRSIAAPFNSLMPWVAHHVLHAAYPADSAPNGSGDTMFNYVQEFVFLALAACACAVWTLAGRGTPGEKTRYWIQVYVRYYLGYTLLNYAYAKISEGQFGPPSLGRLLQPYGESSPMGLAWTFLGFSKGYIWFMAVAEGLAGLLLLFRRTLTLGALLSVAVVANIVAINMCFDVPVKLLSSTLLLMALFVLAADARRFFDFFVRNRPVPAIVYTPVFRSKKVRIGAIVVKSLFVALFAVAPVADMIWSHEDPEDRRSALYGIYEVQQFVRNGDTLPPLACDSTRWNKVVVAYAGYAQVQEMDRKRRWYVFKPDTQHHTITMYAQKDSLSKSTLRYERQDSVFVLTGRLKDDSLWIKMNRADERKFLLMNRGFHWVSEYPFNR